MTQTTDPDQGTFTYNYDANGNQTYIRDNRGDSTGTVWLCYDGLNRKTRLITGDQCSTSPTLATWSYDSGTDGTGHLTSETWSSNGSTGSYNYTYDGRGQQTQWTSTLNSTAYPFSFGYNDAGMPTTLTYPDGTVLTASYTNQGWPSAATVNRSGTNTTLVSAIGYTGTGGAAMEPTSASIGNGTYSAAYSYDGLARLSSLSVINASSQLTEFSQSRGYDSVGNVTSVNTTLPAGTDNQAFCYDEFNRLTWAGSTGTPSCGASLTEGTLTSAAYTQSYAYDQNNRLTTWPAGAYTYGDSSFRDAVTSTSNGYGAAYDGAGDMTCRAPSSSQACSGTQTGQQIGYDQLRRILSWKNGANTAYYAYDGEGNRVIQNSTVGGTNTVTYYLGKYEEVATSGGTTSTTKYYAAGPASGVDINGTLTYLVSDGLGNASASLDTNGNEVGADLYLPYGGVRYTNGSLSTSKGFTGQLQDPSGLDYFHARYYDPSVGQFISEDTVQGPNRYGYVAGNPETNTDPTGQFLLCGGLPMPDGICPIGRHHGGGTTNPPPSSCSNTECPKPGHRNPTPPITVAPSNPQDTTLLGQARSWFISHGVPEDKIDLILTVVWAILAYYGQPGTLPGDSGDPSTCANGFLGTDCGTPVYFCLKGTDCSQPGNFLGGDVFTKDQLTQEASVLGTVGGKLAFWGTVVAIVGLGFAALVAVLIIKGVSNDILNKLGLVSAFVGLIAGFLALVGAQDIRYQGEFSYEAGENIGTTNYYVQWNIGFVWFYYDSEVECIATTSLSCPSNN